MEFQSTPLCEGRRCTKEHALPRPIGFQSTPLCEGRRGCICVHLRYFLISIHAPLRGATSKSVIRRDNKADFNPRPSARGDLRQTQKNILLCIFQSTPLCEGRLSLLVYAFIASLFQSTPLCEGRPQHFFFLTFFCFYFNPRPSARGDGSLCQSGSSTMIFQSTPLCEGRPNGEAKPENLTTFQSTPLCEGRLADPAIWDAEMGISIHAPLRGATIYIIQRLTAYRQFQSTPLCEGRLYYILYKCHSQAFQSTPLCEGRRSLCQASFPSISFQSTPLCEGRQ